MKLIHLNKSKCLKLKVTKFKLYHMNSDMKFNNKCIGIRNRKHFRYNQMNSNMHIDYMTHIKNYEYKLNYRNENI